MKPSLDPCEWDFRGITDKELMVAVPYEYARSSERILKSVTEFMKTPIYDLPDGSGSISVREALGSFSVSQTFEDWWDEMLKLCPCSLANHHSLGYNEGSKQVLLLFPEPWVKLPTWVRDSVRESSDELSSIEESLLADPSVIDITEDSSDLLGQFRDHALRIDWDAPDKKLIKDFKSWLEKHRPTRSIETRGKKDSILRDQLKWLSALRLHNSGCAWNSELIDFLRSLRSDVIPAYDSQGAWITARKKAAQIVDSQ